MNTSKFINVLLILSAINLTFMIPGGFIESRDFSHIPSQILGSFNIFLTTLGIVSLFLVYFTSKQLKWAHGAAFFCGLSYFIVYTIDLLKIFPQSPTAMPPLLFSLEFVGTLLAIPLMFYSIKRTRELKNGESKMMLSKTLYLLIGIAIVIGLGIIIFATNAAMTKK